MLDAKRFIVGSPVGINASSRENEPIGQMTIREATVEDMAILLRLVAAAFEEYVGVLDPPSGAHNETIETIGRKLASGAAALALVEGEPAGCAFYEPHDCIFISGACLSCPGSATRESVTRSSTTSSAARKTAARPASASGCDCNSAPSRSIRTPGISHRPGL